MPDGLEFDWGDLLDALENPSVAVETVPTDRATVVIAPDGAVACLLRFPPSAMQHFQIAMAHMEDHTCVAGEGFAWQMLAAYSAMAQEISEPWMEWKKHHPQQAADGGWSGVDLTEPPPPERWASCG